MRTLIAAGLAMGLVISGHMTASSAQHEHRAPHGGALIELGEEFAHLELVLNAHTGTLTAYVLDGEAEHAVRIGQDLVALEIRVANRPVPLALAPVANVLTGEQAGDASQFARQHERLKGLKTFTGVVKSVLVRGQAFNDVAFTFPGGSPH
jgi:hypothetical protein